MGCQPMSMPARWLGQAEAISPSGPYAQYPFSFSHRINLNNLNMIQTLEICSNSNKFDKKMNSIFLFEFKLIL
jgi:hypothetical protein